MSRINLISILKSHWNSNLIIVYNKISFKYENLKETISNQITGEIQLKPLGIKTSRIKVLQNHVDFKTKNSNRNFQVLAKFQIRY